MEDINIGDIKNYYIILLNNSRKSINVNLLNN
jgi:hypothetical protein